MTNISLQESVRKFRIKDKYFSKSKDGMVMGKRKKSKGRHITIVKEGKRMTIHITDEKSGERKNLFVSEDFETSEKEISAQLESVFEQCSAKRYPKVVYAMPNSLFSFDLKFSKRGKECTWVSSYPRDICKSLIKMPFNDFLACKNTFLGATRFGAAIMKIPKGCIIMNQKTQKCFERLISKILLFAALDEASRKL